MTEWKPIPGIPGYEAGDDGQIVSYLRKGPGHRLSTQRCASGHLRVTTNKGTKLVHRLILFAFVGPPPEGMICRHLNGIADDNRLENLTWGTPLENSDDRRRHGYRAPKRIVCDKGHRLTPDNTKVSKDGSRRCRICLAASRERERARRKPDPSVASGLICGRTCPTSRKRGIGLIPGVCNRPVTNPGDACWTHDAIEQARVRELLTTRTGGHREGGNAHG